MTKTEAIKSLERRADFLAQKIAQEHKDGRPLFHERRELGALKLAIHSLQMELETFQETPA